MNIELGDLKEGEYRELTDEELDELYEMIKDSYSASKIPEKETRRMIMEQ